MTPKHFLYIALATLLAACSDNEEQWALSPAQQTLIGRGVDFSASIADPFATRATYRHDGSFNQDDEMTIYRQYAGDDGNFDSSTEAYRVYSLQSKTATGTSIVLSTDWKPLAGKMGKDAGSAPFKQTDADSLTWDNGKTVRFRAWSRSNLANAIANSTNKVNYYPDYCVSEWVTVSGPTIQIPLTLKHQGCRIGFIPKSGNEMHRAEICFEAADYMWEDNADTHANDEADKLADAVEKADSVRKVYNRMCMPAGIDVSSTLLSAMKKDSYRDSTNFTDLRTWKSDAFVTMGVLSPAEIASDVQRPLFASNDGRLYMITIPYDMSGANTSGEALTLPAWTRFKVWLYDVNNGDKANTQNEEANYHIFSLSDIMDGDDPRFPNGLELIPGRSYTFTVGYHYDKFDITPADDFSWKDDETPETGHSFDQTSSVTMDSSYSWWKDSIKAAIPKGDGKFNPVFHIKNEKEFLEFINLVNGTGYKKDGLEQVYDAEKKMYRWYSSEKTVDGKLRPSINPGDSVTHEWAEGQGYIFYEHYHPSNADQDAYSREDYLRSPFSFYNDQLNRHFTVYLDADLDFKDSLLSSIGNTPETPFCGVFDGYDEKNGKIHKLKNFNMKDSYLFKNCKSVAIRNLEIETVHNFMLVDQASPVGGITYGAYIVGISIKAPSSGNPIARSLTGSSYVVGCFYQGRAGGAMVGTADNLTMYANMMAASGLAPGTGALLGSYATTSKFFAPQTGKKVAWGNFMANYYDVTLSPGTNAVGDIPDAYLPQQYIRGRESWILKAKEDNLLANDVPYESLTSDQMKKGFYGLAPWKALNYALFVYNSANVEEHHDCESHFVNDTTGYAHVYPWRVYGRPKAEDGSYSVSWNLLEQNN